VSKSLQVLFKEYPSLQKDQLWLTYKKKKKQKKRESEKKARRRKKRKKKIKQNKKKVSKEGSKHEPAGSTRVKKPTMCACLQALALHIT